VCFVDFKKLLKLILELCCFEKLLTLWALETEISATLFHHVSDDFFKYAKALGLTKKVGILEFSNLCLL